MRKSRFADVLRCGHPPYRLLRHGRRADRAPDFWLDGGPDSRRVWAPLGSIQVVEGDT